MPQSDFEVQVMRRCLQLATRAEGMTAPNPMVGAVVVHHGEIIGEGYHRAYGEPHAEVNAIASVRDKSLLRESELYVTLEPCSHYGKTPPCSQLIIDSGIPRVVVSAVDPNPKVDGRGIRLLRQAGVDVKVGVEAEAARFLNRRFYTYFTRQRPYIILKWAQSSDGFIDTRRDDATTPPARLSNEVTKTLNHKMRTEEGAILVGTNTVLLDNPHLTTRRWTGKNPLRLIIDRTLRVPRNYKIFDDSADTVVFTARLCHDFGRVRFARLDFERPIGRQIADYLYTLNCQSVIVEGGRMLLDEFIAAGLWDECHIETAAIRLRDGVAAPPIPTEGWRVSSERLEANTMDLFVRNDNPFYTAKHSQ